MKNNQNSEKDVLHNIKEKEQIEILLEFFTSTKKYCICMVDMVGSTRIALEIPESKLSRYYGVFLNSMAEIIKSFGGSIVKNIGDSLLYYFPNSDSDKREVFESALKCCIAMIGRGPALNKIMANEGLPDINYRISCEYGNVIIAKMSTSSVNDIFGNTVNLCSKINSLAVKNSIVIGEGLFQKVKESPDYEFTEIKETNLYLDREYKVYSVSLK